MPHVDRCENERVDARHPVQTHPFVRQCRSAARGTCTVDERRMTARIREDNRLSRTAGQVCYAVLPCSENGVCEKQPADRAADKRQHDTPPNA